MTFLLPYNVRCDALHLNCSIMISWNLFFALHKIHTTHRIPGDFSRLRLKVEKFLFASFCTHKRLFAHNMYKYKGIFFGLHISVWLQFKSYVNVRRLLKIFSCLFSCNTYLTTDRIAVITINVHIIFLCYIMIRVHINHFITFFVISLEYLRNAIKHFYSTSSIYHVYSWFR